MSSEQTAIKATYFSIIGNTSLLLKVYFFGNSYALIADAIESTADILLHF
jgi:divalent metal cation (Fe/Co/Zn/Cd) transporter